MHIIKYQNAYHVNTVRVRSNHHFTYLESTLQHQRHKIQKAPSRTNFSYLSGNFSSCVACNVMVNMVNNTAKPQNFQERQKRRGICEGRLQGFEKKGPPTSFSLVTSTSVGASPSNVLTFSFNSFVILV